MTTPQTREGTRRTGNGRHAAVEAIVDSIYDFWEQALQTQSGFWVQALDMQRRTIKSVADLAGPLYSAVDEADEHTREAVRGPRDKR